MKPKLYLETTVPSYLAGWPSRDLLVAAHQQITRDWWQSRRSEFDLYASELVLTEVRAGDAGTDLLAGVPLLPTSRETMELAEDLITEGTIPRKAAGDAGHIAIATVNGCEYLLTWNCRYIANAELNRSIRRVVERHGFNSPILCTPQRLMRDDEPVKWKDEIVLEVRHAGEAYAAQFDYDVKRMFQDLKEKEKQETAPLPEAGETPRAGQAETATDNPPDTGTATRRAREAAGRSIHELRKGNLLGPDLTIRDLIDDGRRF